MSAGRAVQTFGLQVPPGDEPTPIVEFGDYPATIRLTMAALNPLEKTEGANADDFRGAVLKIIRIPEDDEDESDDEDYDDDMAHLLDENESDEDDEEDEDVDDSEVKKDVKKLAKMSKAEKTAELKALVNGVKNGDIKIDEDEEMDEDEDSDEDDDEDDEDLDDDELPAPEEFVLCSLDPKQHYQQPIDITIDERETVFFQVSGTHTVYLTGNIIMPPFDDYEDTDEDDSEDEDDYDLSPDEDELLAGELDDEDDEDEEDELDDLENPRVTEVDDEEDAPALVAAAATGKGKNKRAAEDDSSMVDLSMASATSADADKPLSKKQQKKLAKKLKDNEGNAVAPAATEDAKPAGKDKKSVQFKEGLVQGPTPSGTTAAGPKTVQGVIIDDRKVGSGPVAKKGDKISMRYIGKLEKDKSVFDSNKKGKPFTFTLGKGEVIKGWDIGVAGMAAGGERRITVPPQHGYGSAGAGPKIPGNATLIFDLKLLEIK